jgi:hypothetical protein
MQLLRFLVVMTSLGLLLPGCTRDTFQRSTYETLQNIQEQRCCAQPGLECPPRERYDQYQRRRTGTL